MRVLTALGARRRSQIKHSLDLKRHMRRNFGDDNFAVRSRMSRQVDDSYVVQIEKSR